VKENFYKKLKRVFYKFPKKSICRFCMDFNAKVGREDIFKPSNGNASLHEISIDNGVLING
jgi:hypothetical protein